MLFFIKRYLPTALLVSFIAGCLWVALIIYAEGWIPALGGIGWLLATVLTIPVMMYLDYREMRSQMQELQEALMVNGSVSSTKVVDSLVSTLGGKFGIPESLLSGAVKIAEEQTRSRLKSPN
jgi:hypothetical protein